MKAREEIQRLVEKLNDGSLPEDEPLFVIRARDVNSDAIVRYWSILAGMFGASQETVDEAKAFADQMKKWPWKQVPGCPDTLKENKQNGT